MAGEKPSTAEHEKTMKSKKGRVTRSSVSSKSSRKDSLKWGNALKADDDPFALFAGGEEGGFLSLEEIDESEYGFIGGATELVGDEFERPVSRKLRKRKRKSVDEDLGGEGGEERKEEDGKSKKKRKKKKQKKKESSSKGSEESKEGLVEDIVPVVLDAPMDNDVKEDTKDDLLLAEDEFYAWKELRLHPLLMKSIHHLRFKEPTPIQKACIPAAAHQGKDVIGAAETGSGKTLAFGLPILQRLLEEREKAARFIEGEVKAAEEVIRGGPLRALIVTPTRELALQVSDHLKSAARFTHFQVLPIVGGMSTEKQERLLKRRPEIIVGTPGRLWELMSRGDVHLVELHSLSFFVLDEADRMIEHGHFHELQSIIDMLPTSSTSADSSSLCKTIPSVQRKKRQTFVFSATISLSDNFRKKLKRGLTAPKTATTGGLSSIETLSERAGMRADAAIVDLTNASIMADKLEESFIECNEDDKEAYLYYILSVHGHGRTIVFCTSIAALRRISSIMNILGIKAWSLHAQMQQRARLKAMDRFRGNENAVLIATDVAARGLDFPGIRTVVHYQLPHSAEVYIHRSGRTARASADGCSIALISPNDKTKFSTLCRSLSKESLKCFPVDNSYMPEVMKRLSLARQIDKISRNNSQETAKKRYERVAESVGLDLEEDGSEDERVHAHKQKKLSSAHLKKLQQELNDHLSKPLQPKSFSYRFLAGAGISPLLQKQLEELSKKPPVSKTNSKEKRPGLVVIGQDCLEPLQALRTSGREVSVTGEKAREMRKTAENLKRKRREEKKSAREQRRKKNKSQKEAMK
ncbi:DEAD-box ATP-dependent RNA helicase 13 isoform X2 [Dioscorea cayenensis subsp. rotundata]|uniref:DEAD-box ATP-dependent RNA helicase 13 isoform X2 n=1 Tax=Dioscorea cayennensis subsp. rotundata TaxID=55577 RepID=A0AB40CKF6_DIOCR|nr:DEAD-box ATP-dependent RNA helicase 13 isoform X2 [Dioscorea cayenensis subsp. rotundata]